jgi:hypothetical protein
MRPNEAKSDHAPLWGVLKWLGKVLAGAALGGVTAAFTAYTTFQGMQNDVQAQGATQRIHAAEIRALQAADVAHDLTEARADAKAAAEREADKEQLRQIRADLQFIQQVLIGRVRR